MMKTTPKPATAEAIAAEIKETIRLWNAYEIEYEDFTKRQRAAWDQCRTERMHQRVADIVFGRALSC